MRNAYLKTLSSIAVLLVFLVGTTALLVVLVTAHAYAPHPTTPKPALTGSGICTPGVDCLHWNLKGLGK
jgi:hypothetical protein